MMEEVQEWLRSRPRNPPGILSLLSTLLFSSLCLISAALLENSSTYWWWLFGILIVIDLLGMLASVDSVVSADRALFFVVVAITVVVRNPSDVFLSALTILVLIAVLDFSFLLRNVDGTGVDMAVFTNRAKSYAYTVLPAFLLTYLLLFVYSQNIVFSLYEAAVVLGLASAGALIVVYAVVRFMLSFYRRT